MVARYSAFAKKRTMRDLTPEETERAISLLYRYNAVLLSLGKNAHKKILKMGLDRNLKSM